MLTRIKHWLEPPHFDGDEEKTAQARVLNTLIINLGIALLVATLVLVPFFAVRKIGAWAILAVFFGGLGIGRHQLHRGQFLVTKILVVAIAWLCFLVLTLFSGGSTSPAMVYLALVTLIAGFILDYRVANALTILTILVALGITFLENQGFTLPGTFVFTPLVGWLIFGPSLVFMNSARNLFVRNLEDALARARQENAARHLAEQSLRASEERNATLLRAIPDQLFQVNRDGIILDYHTQKESDWNVSAETFLGKNLTEIMPPQVSDAALKAIDASLRAQTIVTFEYDHASPTGARVYENRIVPITQTDVLSVIRDITERKRMEHELLKFKLGIDRSVDAVFITDPQGVIMYTNPAFEKIYGYTQEDVRGQTPRILKSGLASLEHYQQFWATLLNKGVVAGEINNKTKDGRLITIEGSNNPILDVAGNIIGFLGMHRDITGRKQTEAALRASEGRLKRAHHTAHLGNWEWNLTTNELYWAEENYRIHGIDPAKVKPSFEAFIQLVIPAERELVKKAVADALASKSLFEIDYTIIRPDNGERCVINSKADVLVDSTGESVRMVGTVLDITERKQHETELQAIASLSAALRTAATRAEMLPVIVEQLVALLNCETASIEIIDPRTGDAVTEVAHGIWKSLIGTHQKNGTGINAIISQTRQPYYTNDLKNDPNLAYPEWTHEEICGGVGAPLIAQDNLIGFVWIGRKTEISDLHVRLLSAVADIAANAIYRATLHEQTLQVAVDLTHAYDTTLEGWARALELRDQETEGHTRRVTQMTVDLARAMGSGADELENVRRGALLHDIGKMGIPDSVLLKPGTLNEREWEIMRRHPEYAYTLLAPIDYLHPALDIPYCHHEKWDGSGYPRGLKGEEIPLAARIFAIVDVWDALRSNRPYRKAWNAKEARAYIRAEAGKHFDPRVVEAFLNLISLPDNLIDGVKQ